MTKQLTPEMKAALGQFRDRVSDRFEAQMKSANDLGKKYINNKAFFFGVVAEYFANMGVGLQRKCLKDSLEMMIQLNKAIVKAEFAIAAPERKANARMFNGNYATRYGA